MPDRFDVDVYKEVAVLGAGFRERSLELVSSL